MKTEEIKELFKQENFREMLKMRTTTKICSIFATS